MSVSAQRSTKGVLRNLHKLTDALLEENGRLHTALADANAQIAALHAALELLRRDVAARDRYDGEVRDYVAAIIGDIQRQYKPVVDHASPAADAIATSPVRTALADIHAESQRPPPANDDNPLSPPSSTADEAVVSDAPLSEEEATQPTTKQPAEHMEAQTAHDSEPELEAQSAEQQAVQTREAIILAPQQHEEHQQLHEPLPEPEQAQRTLHHNEGSTHELQEQDMEAPVPQQPEVTRSVPTEHEQLAVHEEEEEQPSEGEYSAEGPTPIEQHEAQFDHTQPELHEEESHDEAEPTHEDIHSDEDRTQSQGSANIEATRSITAVDTTAHVEQMSHDEEPQLDDEALDVSHLTGVLVPEPSEPLQRHSDEEPPLASLLDPSTVPKQVKPGTEGTEQEQSEGQPEHSEQVDHSDELHDLSQDAPEEVRRQSMSSKGVSDDSEYQYHSGDTSGHEGPDVDNIAPQVGEEIQQHQEGGPSTHVVDPNPYNSPTQPVASSSQPRLKTIVSLPFAADVVQKPGDSPHEVAQKIYEAGGQNYESCSSVFRVIRKKRSSVSDSGEEDDDEQHNIEFVTLRRQTAEVLPWKARKGSDYIDVTNGALAVKPLAAVASRFGTASLSANLRVLEPLRMPASRKDFCYISPEYPDGTSLPYVPVNNVILQHQPRDWVGEEYGVNKVRLSFQKHVFEEVKSIAIEAYKEKYPGSNVMCDSTVTPKRARKIVDLDADAQVDVSVFLGRPIRLGIPEALSLIELDIVGLVLLYIGVNAKNDDGSEAELAFRIHSMVMKRAVRKKLDK